ncbi:MAG: hypothetical protein A2204_01880, partial [Elusimicrobia bacterium RIFOXYA1_FULL_47_7]
MTKETQQQLNLSDMLELLIRKRNVFLVLFSVVFFSSVLAGLFMPRVYEASSLIKVRGKKIIDPLVSEIAVAPQIAEEINTLSKQIMAWPKLEQLVLQLNLVSVDASQKQMEDYITNLRKRVNVRFVNREIIQVVYQDGNPRRAQMVANTLTQNFIEESSQGKREEAKNAIDFINEQLKIYRAKLENSEQNFTVSKIDSDLRVAQNRRTLLKDRLANLQKIIPSQVTTEQNPVVSQLQARAGQIESELARLLIDAKEGNPKVQELQTELTGLKARISSELEKTTVKESISTFNPMYLQTEQELKQMDMEISYLEKRRESLLTRSVRGAKKLGEEGLANLERNKRVDEDIYQMLLRQLESAYVSERLQDSEKGNQFTVLEYARLPLKPVKPNFMKILLFGFFGGLMLGGGGVFLLENIFKTFHTPEQAQAVLGFTGLGSVGTIAMETQNKDKKEFRAAVRDFLRNNKLFSKIRIAVPHIALKRLDPSVAAELVVYHDPRSRIADDYRMLKTNIFHGLNDSGKIKKLLITSAIHGEGKSTTSANLAAAIAAGGSKVLLVDCDLRKGLLHAFFSAPVNPGVSDILLNSIDPQKACRQTPVNNLWFLPCGAAKGNPTELMGSPSFKELINSLSSQFEIIVMDSPPVLNMPDAMMLSKFSDAVVVAIESGKTHQKDVINIKSSLRQVGAKVLGFVMTRQDHYMPRYMH